MAKPATLTNSRFSDPLDGPIDDTLDLHGFTRAEACARVRSYLGDERRRRGLV